jgi:hypothetical protein
VDNAFKRAQAEFPTFILKRNMRSSVISVEETHNAQKSAKKEDGMFFGSFQNRLLDHTNSMLDVLKKSRKT